ncbi:Gfo/Idh/MocA family oxidoreductase [Plantactinospora sp. S1510]|uniref:Gfo/Idh/MocA family oxidoreductase n=1 Tax=Plantactinospora alkalitolerans TaxID=2789879 RepID=A0ABS0HBI2_9ACTN|nr:Gfo/Idh/MocA family oxidoreductase [Plantactinospora alkalitolerans]
MSGAPTGRPVRWGILGTGWVAGEFVSDLVRLPDAEVVAVGSRTRAAAVRFADHHEIPRAYGNWAEFLADDGVDVVYVATPHSTHHAAVTACLDAGRPVLCEKPFTVNAGEAADLVARARSAGLFVMEAMWMRCVPAIRRLVELVRDGAVGVPRLVQADLGLVAPVDPGHRLRDPALGGGALLDLGIYPVTLAHLLLGPPESVTAVATLSPYGIDETTAILLGHRGGALATLSCSIVADTPWTAAISGSAGRIELGRGFFRPAGLTLYPADAEPRLIEVPFEGEGFVHEAVEVGRCLRAGLTESPLATAADTIAVLRTLDAVRARTGVRYQADELWKEHPVSEPSEGASTAHRAPGHPDGSGSPGPEQVGSEQVGSEQVGQVAR